MDNISGPSPMIDESVCKRGGGLNYKCVKAGEVLLDTKMGEVLLKQEIGYFWKALILYFVF